MADSATTPRDVWLWRGIWFAVLAGLLGLSIWGATVGSAWLRDRQVRHELAQLTGMVEKFRERHGVYPSVSNNAVLLRCLLGRADPHGHPIQQPWFVTGARLHFREDDPEKIGNEIVDPWGRPYVYIHVPSKNGQPEGFLLLSGGNDRRHSAPLLWHWGDNGTAPEDADNVFVRSP